jgi:hypothetical protein
MLAGASISAFGFITSDIPVHHAFFAFGRIFFSEVSRMSIHASHPGYRDCDPLRNLSFSPSSDFSQLAILSNVAVLLLYFLCCGAALQLMRRDVLQWPPVRLSGAWMCRAAAVISLWILAQATDKNSQLPRSCWQ